MLAFDQFRLDLKRRALWAGEARVELQAKQLDILAYLVAGRDGPVSKSAIQAQLWPGLAISDKVVPVHISLLRRALAAHGGDGLIISAPGGYRFVGDVREIAAPAGEAAGVAPLALAVLEPGGTPAAAQAGVASLPVVSPGMARRYGVWAAAGLLACGLAGGVILRRARPPAPPALSIAVLPFRNLTDGGGGGYMADAVTEDLNTDLAHIPGSLVTARGSTVGLRDHPTDDAAIGRALNVRYLVDGSLRVVDGATLINAALIEAASGRQLWSERFEAPAGGLAETQSLIVRRIATALDAALPDIVSERYARDRPDDPDAQGLFYQAYALVERQDSLEAYGRAERLLEQALRLRPGYGDASAELGLTLMLRVQSADDPDEAQDLAKARAVIAQALDLTHGAIAYAANARLLEMGGDCAEAEVSAQTALSQEPNNIDALAVLARCASDAGKLDEAVVYLHEVLQLNPGSPREKARYALLSQTLLLQGHYGEAIEAGNKALAGDPAPQPGAETMSRAEYVRLVLMAATALQGDDVAAHADYAKYRVIWPSRSTWRIGALAQKRLASTPGFARFLTGLTMAGMPMYADQTAATSLQAGEGGEFASTPGTLPGAATLDTAGLAALQKAGPITILDVGHGACSIAGADLIAPTALHTQFGPALANYLPSDRNSELVVMGDGIFGNSPILLVRMLVERGYRRVRWYRGGEEAWSAHGMPCVDRRVSLSG